MKTAIDMNIKPCAQQQARQAPQTKAKTQNHAWAKVLAFSAIWVLLGSSTLHAQSYTLGADSHIGFEVKKFGMMTIKGNFRESSGELTLENNAITALKGEIVIESVFTDNAKRDAHLLEADFLDSKLAPRGYFVMKSYEAQKAGESSAETSGELAPTKGKVKGMLSLHGVEREIVLDSALSFNNGAPTLALESEINIKDFAIAGSFMNSDSVKILLQTTWEQK